MEGLEREVVEVYTEDSTKTVGLGGNSVCDVCVLNRTNYVLENVTAKYWQANSITGHREGSTLNIVHNIALNPEEQSQVFKNLEYDTTPNPRNDHWSMEFECAGQTYRYKDKKCNITKSDAGELVKLEITGTPKKFTFHVAMPKSSSCKGTMD